MVELTEQELEDLEGDLKLLFRHPGWKQIMEIQEDNISAIDNSIIRSAKSMEEVMYYRGQRDAADRLLNLQNLMEQNDAT
jgi:hypothetical protein